MNAILENEVWEVKPEIAPEFQDIIRVLLRPSVPIEKVHSARNNDSTPTLHTFIKIAIGQSEGAQTVHKFFLVDSALMFSKLLYDYVLFLDQLPLIATDIVIRIIELFELFNSSTYTLVLRKGALKIT